MEIRILGSGCPNCKVLARQVDEVIEYLDIDAEVIKISDMAEIISYGIVHMPALVIDGELIINGWVPRRDELESILRTSVMEEM